ncbi:MAG: tetratricopeptide repeat protein [Campylobacterota bacterium]|nr:tetratricopeptide repeat protein [Campylobacterota bacterium]
MKKKCPLCQTGKPRRECIIRNNEIICSKCCAEIRDNSCMDCQYYESNQNYNTTKKTPSFIIEIDEQLNEKIDDALILLENNQIVQARPKILEFFENYPNYYYANFAMSSLHLFEGDMDKGMEYINKTIELHPVLTEAYINKALAYKKKYDIGNMILTFQIVLELEEKADDREYYNLAKQEIDAATPLLDGLTPKQYIQASELFQKAFSYLDAKDFETAKEYFLKSLAIKSDSEQSYGNLGICCAALGQKEEAIQYLNKSLSLNPNYEPALLHLTIIEDMSIDEMVKNFDSNDVETIEYYKEYGDGANKKKSLISDILSKMKK